MLILHRSLIVLPCSFLIHLTPSQKIYIYFFLQKIEIFLYYYFVLLYALCYLSGELRT